MKRMAQKGLAGLLLLVMLLLAVPATALTVLAEDPEPAIYNEFDSASQVLDLTGTVEGVTGIKQEAVKKTYPDSDDKYEVLLPVAKEENRIEGVISDGDGGYTPISTYNAAFKAIGLLDKYFSNSANLAMLQNKDRFLLEISFPKIDTEYAISANIRFRYDTAMNTETGARGGATAGATLISVDTNGNVNALGKTLGNVKTESVHLSLCFEYSAADSAYLVTAYVNGAVKLDRYKCTSFGISAKDLHDNPAYGLCCLNINGSDKHYGEIYTATGETFEGKTVYTKVALTKQTTDAFDENGNCRYSLAMDKIRVQFGTSEAYNAHNVGKTLLLLGDGSAVAGTTPALNDAKLLSCPVSSGETTALPAGYTWYDKAGNVLTEVPSSLALGGEIVAAMSKEGVLAGNDFSANTDGFTVTGKLVRDDALGKLVLTGNTPADATDANLTYQSNVSFGSGYFFDTATLTLKMTLEHGGTEALPNGTVWRIRSYGRTADIVVMEIVENQVSVLGSLVALEPGKPLDLVYKVSVENCRDGNGTVTGTNVTVVPYVNGVCYPSKTYLNHGFKLGTGTDEDLGYFQLQQNKIRTQEVESRMLIDNVSIAIDTQEDDAAAYDFSSYSGASIRPASEKETAGLRFGFRFDKDYYDALTKGAESVEVGAYVVPEDYLTGGVLNGDVIATLSASKELLKFTVDGFSTSEDVTNEDTYGFYASIVNLKDYNYARAFRAIAYVTVDGVTVFSTASESRSANQVARNMAKSGDLDGKYASMKSLITDTYLDTVACLDASCNLIALDGYTAPYTVTVTGTETLFVKLTASDGFDLDSIKTIVIAGKCYSASGCSITVDPLDPERATELSFTYVPTT